jgi:hypothetical protein
MPIIVAKKYVDSHGRYIDKGLPLAAPVIRKLNNLLRNNDTCSGLASFAKVSALKSGFGMPRASLAPSSKI